MLRDTQAKKLHSGVLETAYEQLTRDGLLCMGDNGLETGKRWQAAIMRATAELLEEGGAADQDLRIPFVRALLSIYGSTKSVEELSDYVLVMMEVESRWIEKIQLQQKSRHYH